VSSPGATICRGAPHPARRHARGPASAILLILAAAAAAGGASEPAARVSIFPLAPVWTVSLPAQPAAPAAFNGRFGFFPMRGGQVSAIFLRNGRLRWTAAVPDAQHVAAGGDQVFVATLANVQALSAEDGSLVWQVPIVTPVTAPLTYGAGWLIVASGSEIVALAAADGTPQWRMSASSAVQEAPVIVGDRLYVVMVDGLVTARRIEDGGPLWERRVAPQPGALLVVGDRLYLGAADNYFYCLDERDGSVRWRWRTGGDIRGAAAIDEDRVYFFSFDNLVRALDRRSGVQRWRHALGMRPLGPVQLLDGVLIAAGIGRTIRGFRTDTGAVLGEFQASSDLVSAPFITVLAERRPEPALIVTLANGDVLALRHTDEPPAMPLTILPGRAITPDPPPGFSRPRLRKRPGEAPFRES
jgi:outer membrane protein assembly factor BamB